MLEAVDETPLTRGQKLLLYKAGVCPRLTWPLLIEEYPITWVERKLDTITTHYLKQWAGLAKAANTAILYLPFLNSGLNLPLLSTLRKKTQVSCQCQQLTSRDCSVRYLAGRNLQREVSLPRKKFRPSTVARDTLAEYPERNRMSLAKAAKAIVADEASSTLLDNFQSLVKQNRVK